MLADIVIRAADRFLGVVNHCTRNILVRLVATNRVLVVVNEQLPRVFLGLLSQLLSNTLSRIREVTERTVLFLLVDEVTEFFAFVARRGEDQADFCRVD